MWKGLERLTWDTSNVQRPSGVVRGEGKLTSGVAVVCVEFQVQDVLFDGDWKKGSWLGLSPEERLSTVLPRSCDLVFV